MSTLLIKVAFLFYLFSSLFYLANLSGKKWLPGKGAFYALTAGLFFHTHIIILYFYRAGHSPLMNVHGSLIMLSWILFIGLLFVELYYRMPVVGSFAAPLALILYILAVLKPVQILPPPPLLNGIWFPLHTIFSLLGLAFFLLNFTFSVMYLLQQRQIKGKILGRLFHRLPPLEDLDRLNRGAVHLGFILLTLGLIAGFVGVGIKGVELRLENAKVWWSVLTWLIYGALLQGELLLKWRGKRIARISIMGFIVLLITMLGASHGFWVEY